MSDNNIVETGITKQQIMIISGVIIVGLTGGV